MNHEEMLTLIKTRRSCRSYRPDAVPEDVLDKVLEAGTYAPTGGGRQSPVIIAVRDPRLRSALSAMNAEIMGGDSDPYYARRWWCWFWPRGTPSWRTAPAFWKT